MLGEDDEKENFMDGQSGALDVRRLEGLWLNLSSDDPDLAWKLDSLDGTWNEQRETWIVRLFGTPLLWGGLWWWGGV